MDLKNYIKKMVNNKHDLKKIIIVSLIIICLILMVQDYSLQKKLDAQETINDGLISENSELTTKLESYYSSNVMEVEEEPSIDPIVEDNCESETITLEEKSHGKSLQKELSDVKKELEEVKAEEKRLTEIYNKLLAFVNSDYLGTDDYHSNQYIIFTDGEEKEITVTARSTRKYTTTVEGDNSGIATEWVSPFENYQAKLKFIPKDEGVTSFHFTNSFNSESFDVIVIYLNLNNT